MFTVVPDLLGIKHPARALELFLEEGHIQSLREPAVAINLLEEDFAEALITNALVAEQVDREGNDECLLVEVLPCLAQLLTVALVVQAVPHCLLVGAVKLLCIKQQVECSQEVAFPASVVPVQPVVALIGVGGISLDVAEQILQKRH
jgi:hypothetical protein